MLEDALINRAAPPGSLRYFSLLYTPAERRDALLALFVIDAEIRDSARSVNHDVAHSRLHWWRSETDRLVSGNPQHPATRQLQQLGFSDRKVFEKLHEMLVAADMELARLTFLNMREMRVYCARSGGALAELIASQLVAPEHLASVRDAANRIGVGIRQSEILRELRQDAYDGNVFLPLDLLDQHQLQTEHLRASEISAPLREVLTGLRDAAKQELAALPDASHLATLRPLIVLGALHGKLLDRIAASNYDVASERIELTPWQKTWTSWRAARRAR